MSFGIANNVRSKEVRTCTPELFHRALESRVVAEMCAQIKDALEAVRRGEMSPEEFETLKGNLKKALIIFTFHATFKNGRRKNEEAIPSGFSIYDLDHIQNPEIRWEEIALRKEELGIVLAHITPSSEGLRLVFIVPQGMDLAEAQAWMAKELKDETYDACVKDYARCSFAVPKEYVLYLDEEKLFSTQVDAPEIIRRDAPQDDKVVEESYPTTFKGIPYATIIAEWFKQNGGEPERGERNSKLHRLASHLRYITDNNEEVTDSSCVYRQVLWNVESNEEATERHGKHEQGRGKLRTHDSELRTSSASHAESSSATHQTIGEQDTEDISTGGGSCGVSGFG